MERIYEFLPSILIIAIVAGATFLYLQLVIKRFGDNFNSVEWHKNNQLKVALTVGIPLNSVWAPAVEELIFRAPLIIAFGAMSSVAWYGVLASSALFALPHWFGKKIFMTDVLSAKENSNHNSDDAGAEINRLHTEMGEKIVVRKVFHVVLTLPLGILAGYYGIKYQSIWVAFCIHSVWNLVVPIVVPILILLLALALLGISSLWDSVRRRMMRRIKRSWIFLK